MNKEFLKKCWKNPRWHSLMVLVIWIGVLSLLMGVVSILNQFSSPKESIKKETEQKSNAMSYEDKWKKLLEDHYAYTYTITKNEEIIKYEGTIKDQINSGYRERKDGIIRYSVENGKIYEILVEEKKEMQTLYENVEADFLNPISIHELIKNVAANDVDILEEKEKTTYEYSTQIEEESVKVQVIADDIQIKNITIEKTNETYKLDFNFKN